MLLPKQRYDDALSVMPFATMERLFQSTANRPPPGNDPRIAESIRRSGIGSALDFIEVLAGASDLTHAQTMMGELLSYDGTEQTRKQLGERLARAGQPQLFKTP